MDEEFIIVFKSLGEILLRQKYFLFYLNVCNMYCAVS